MVLLETARLRLRQFTPDDVDRLVELDSDPEVMRYVTFGAPTPRERYVDVFLPRWFAIYRETPLLGYWPPRSAPPASSTAGFIFDRTASMPASRSSATGCDARAGGAALRPRAPRRSSSTGSGGSAPTRSRHVRWQATPPRGR